MNSNISPSPPIHTHTKKKKKDMGGLFKDFFTDLASQVFNLQFGYVCMDVCMQVRVSMYLSMDGWIDGSVHV